MQAERKSILISLADGYMPNQDENNASKTLSVYHTNGFILRININGKVLIEGVILYEKDRSNNSSRKV